MARKAQHGRRKIWYNSRNEQTCHIRRAVACRIPREGGCREDIRLSGRERHRHLRRAFVLSLRLRAREARAGRGAHGGRIRPRAGASRVRDRDERTWPHQHDNGSRHREHGRRADGSGVRAGPSRADRDGRLPGGGHDGPHTRRLEAQLPRPFRRRDTRDRRAGLLHRDARQAGSGCHRHPSRLPARGDFSGVSVARRAQGVSSRGLRDDLAGQQVRAPRQRSEASGDPRGRRRCGLGGRVGPRAPCAQGGHSGFHDADGATGRA